MQSALFWEPVTVYLRRPDGVLRATRICTTEEAYKALTTGEQIPVGKPELLRLQPRHLRRHRQGLRQPRRQQHLLLFRRSVAASGKPRLQGTLYQRASSLIYASPVAPAD